MKVTEHIQNAKEKTLFSFEILPPKKGENVDSVLKNIEPLLQYNPSFIDVTYHREELVYNESPDGRITKHSINRRPGTLGTTSIIQHKFGVDAIPHILCGGFSKSDTENMLIDLNFIGIHNVMALRGDASPHETYFSAHPNGNRFANELVKQIVNLNNGEYIDGHTTSNKTNFQIGVAGYPEKHMEAPNLQNDMKYLKQKIDAGAEYIVTQMFFDNQAYFDFVEKCRAAEIHVPIIPGLKPISTHRHLNIIPHRFHIDLPQNLIDDIENAKTTKEIKAIGIQHCIQQCEELLDFGVPALHFYSMGKAKNVEEVVKEFF